MKKATLLFTFLIFALHFSSSAQYSWNPVGSGISTPVQCMVNDPSSNTLYTGGLLSLGSGTPSLNITKLNGSLWSTLTGGPIAGTGVTSMVMKGNDLIIGGNFISLSGLFSKNIARWDGSSWSPMGSGLTGILGLGGKVNSLTVFNNELYAGGSFSNSGGSSVSNIAKWNGTNWVPVLSGTNGTVNSLCVFNGELYVGGSFTNAGGVSVNNIAKWNGSVWSDVNGGCEYTGATTVSTMKVFNGELFVGGKFSSAGSTAVNNIAKWNGAIWSDVGGGCDYTGATTVSTMNIFNNTLVVGGTFDSLGTSGANNVGSWNGTSWSNLGTGTDGPVITLETYGTSLFAGGTFLTAGNNLALFIAEWKENSSQVLLTGISENENTSFQLYPNPVEDHLSIRNNGKTSFNNCTLTLFNITGAKVFSKKVTEEMSIERGNIISGLYLYRLTDNEGKIISQGKLSFK